MAFTPLPLVDDFLVNYHLGHALLVLFALSVVGTIPLDSRKVVALNASLFGVVFFVTPATQLGNDPFTYRVLGVALLVIAPVLFTTARE